MEKKIYKEPNKSETETTINVLYSEQIINIYTNKVSLQKQLNKILGQPTNEYKIKKDLLLEVVGKYHLKKKSKISQMILKS